MVEKAQLFGDMDTRAKILTEFDPSVPKRLASAKGPLRNFDESTWERQCLRIVTAGNRAKFEQNAELKATLLATVGKFLVEARSPQPLPEGPPPLSLGESGAPSSDDESPRALRIL